jgi:group I intron endonuclease
LLVYINLVLLPIIDSFFSSNSPVNPVASYDNVELDKDRILKENKDKSGVYRLTNLENQKTYIGSSVNLRRRFHVYYSTARLRTSNMAIYKALLKYGPSKFSLEIIEYCDLYKVVSKEQEYINLLKPCYNLNPTAGSSLGYKHSEEALAKLSANMSARMRGRTVSDETRANLSAAATGRVLTAEERAKISAARTGMIFTDEHRSKISEAMSAINGLAVIVGGGEWPG